MMVSQYLLFESTDCDIWRPNEYVGSFQTLVEAKLHAQREDRDQTLFTKIVGVVQEPSKLVRVCEMWPGNPGVWTLPAKEKRMRTLQVIETVQELSDLFKEGKLSECKLIHETNYNHLQGTDEFVLSNELQHDGDRFLRKLFKVAGIPVYIT